MQLDFIFHGFSVGVSSPLKDYIKKSSRVSSQYLYGFHLYVLITDLLTCFNIKHDPGNHIVCQLPSVPTVSRRTRSVALKRQPRVKAPCAVASFFPFCPTRASPSVVMLF